MIRKKVKIGFTLLELITVIGIVSILLTITIPGISTYIDRTNRLNVITQSRNVVQYSISSNLDIGNSIKLSDLVDSYIFSDYEGRLDFLQNDMEISTLLAISSDQNAINKIKIKDKKIVEWTGENPYKKSGE